MSDNFSEDDASKYASTDNEEGNYNSHKTIFIAIFTIFIIALTSFINYVFQQFSGAVRSEIKEITSITALPTKPPTPTGIPNVCNKSTAEYLPDILEITPAVYVTRTVTKERIYGPGVVTDVITTNERTIVDPNGVPPTEQQITEFKSWALTRGIALIPTSRSYEELKDGVFDLEKDQVPLGQIGQVMQAFEALKLLPDSIIEKMRGTAIYMTTVDENVSYALFSHDSPDEIAKAYKDNKNVVRNGIVLVQPLSKRITIHEIGHLIGIIGIRGIYGDEYSSYGDLREEYKNIFSMQGKNNLPCGYITSYSLTNDSENFADHFSYYVMYGEDFRIRAKDDKLLEAKYNFLKNHIFEGREY